MGTPLYDILSHQHGFTPHTDVDFTEYVPPSLRLLQQDHHRQLVLLGLEEPRPGDRLWLDTQMTELAGEYGAVSAVRDKLLGQGNDVPPSVPYRLGMGLPETQLPGDPEAQPPALYDHIIVDLEKYPVLRDFMMKYMHIPTGD